MQKVKISREDTSVLQLHFCCPWHSSVRTRRLVEEVSISRRRKGRQPSHVILWETHASSSPGYRAPFGGRWGKMPAGVRRKECSRGILGRAPPGSGLRHCSLTWLGYMGEAECRIQFFAHLCTGTANRGKCANERNSTIMELFSATGDARSNDGSACAFGNESSSRLSESFL